MFSEPNLEYLTQRFKKLLKIKSYSPNIEWHVRFTPLPLNAFSDPITNEISIFFTLTIDFFQLWVLY